jgi:hypothetical protein
MPAGRQQSPILFLSCIGFFFGAFDPVTYDTLGRIFRASVRFKMQEGDSSFLQYAYTPGCVKMLTSARILRDRPGARSPARSRGLQRSRGTICGRGNARADHRGAHEGKQPTRYFPGSSAVPT